MLMEGVCLPSRLRPIGLLLNLGSWLGLWAARLLETWVQIPADPPTWGFQAAEELSF